MEAKGKKVFYTKKWDLSDLPSYQPKKKVSGTIRMWGSNYIVDGNVGRYWEEGFRKFHPDIKFDYHMKTTVAAVPALVFGVGDIGVGRKITFAEFDLDRLEAVFDRAQDCLLVSFRIDYAVAVVRCEWYWRPTQETDDGLVKRSSNRIPECHVEAGNSHPNESLPSDQSKSPVASFRSR